MKPQESTDIIHHELKNANKLEGNFLRGLYLFFYGSGGAWRPLLNVYFRQIGLSGMQIGYLSSTTPVVSMLSSPLWGIVADLWGRRRLLLYALFISSFVILGHTSFASFSAMLVITILCALLLSPLTPAIDSLSLEYLERRGRQEGLTYGHLRLYGGLGWAIGAFAVGNIVTGRDIRLTFIVGSVLSIISWFLVWGLKEQKKRSVSKRSWKDVSKVLTNGKLVIFLILVPFLQMGQAPIFTFYPVLMDELGASRKMISIAFALQGFSELPFYLFSGRIIRRMGLVPTLSFACLMFSLRSYLYSVVTIPVLGMMIELLHGLSYSLFFVGAVEMVNREVPPEWRVTGQSLLAATCVGAGAIMGNLWGGYLFDTIGVRSMFRYNSMLILCVAIIAFGVLNRTSKQRG